MQKFQALFRASSAVLVAVAFLSACGGGHGAGQSSLPTVPLSADAKLHAAAVAAASGDVVAINAGGSASGSFAADQDYAAASWTYKTTSTIDTSGVTNPAPQAVYDDEREGATVTYTIPGLTPGASYGVKLSFAELWWTAAGQRVFNVSINNTSVLTNFDIFKTAGGRLKAVAESFTATANSGGAVTITLTAVTNYAAIDAIEISAGSGTTPTPPPASGSVSINSGGGATGAFVADEDYVHSGTYVASATGTIDTSGVTNPAPQAVYQDQRVGPTISYTVPGLTAAAAYTVRLEFAEFFWTAAGQRVFNVGINNANVLTNFDIFAAAGARNKAVAKSFTATASSSGAITIALTGVTNNAVINALEISPAGGSPTAPPTSTPTAAPTPPPGSTSFVDWPTYGYDSGHTGFNPYTTGITPASISKIHLAWQTSGQGSQTQPIIATNVAGHTALLIVGSYTNAQAHDALTGKLAWQTSLPKQDVQACGSAGVSGTVAYDKSLGSVFVVAGNGGGAPNHILLYRLDVATGKITGQVDVTPSLEPGEANDSHAGVLFANGRVYVGTGSDCEGSQTIKYPSWRGRVVAVNPSSMAISSTFFSTWGHGGNFGGGGVWAWGGVSADASGNVYVSTGNAETNLTTGASKITAPFQATDNEQAGYAEHLVKLSADLSTVEGSNYPGFNFGIGFEDLDYTGSPVIYTPPISAGCGTLSATQGKGGTLVINNASNLSVRNSFALSVPSARAYYVGNPGFSPNTGYLYAAITSSGAGSSMLPPGLAAIGDCGSSMVWHAQFGQDSTLFKGNAQRSAPTVTAGGVVFIGTPCTQNGSGGCGTPGTANGAVWAIDAKTGAVLGGGKPVLITGDNIRMAPSADGLWVFVYDNSGNFYGLTVDSSVKAVQAQAGRRFEPMFQIHG